MVLPIWWLTNAMPPSMACQRRPKASTIQPATSGPTPIHRKPMIDAKTRVEVGVGGAMKYIASTTERTK